MQSSFLIRIGLATKSQYNAALLMTHLRLTTLLILQFGIYSSSLLMEVLKLITGCLILRMDLQNSKTLDHVNYQLHQLHYNYPQVTLMAILLDSKFTFNNTLLRAPLLILYLIS